MPAWQPFVLLQDIFNLLPNIDAELNRSFAVKSNDMMLVVYVASLIRSVLALHNLINNKVTVVKSLYSKSLLTGIDPVSNEIMSATLHLHDGGQWM